MMQPILESLARFLANEPGGVSGKTVIILPNRRAGLFLQRHLAKHTKGVSWLPQIWSINDFVNEISELGPIDPVDALFTLYDIYKEVKSEPEPLDEFYYWGELMLRDFDEIDKYLVDSGMLFRNVADLKEIEDPLAGLEDSQITFIRQFWEGFHEGRATPEKEQFLEIWKILPVLYERLREALIRKGEGYQGMQYREIVSRIENGSLNFPPCDKLIVVGFNALNGCEKRIFRWLREHESWFFWDYDHQYTRDSTNEAGRFMRENLVKYPSRVELESFNGIEVDKEIRIFELPTDVLQAKTVHRILERKEPVPVSDCTDTAVVLCDEGMLIPVLLSVPASAGEINVTMGYPMGSTPVYGFLDALFRLQHNIRKSREGEFHFYHKDVRTILLHPYMEGSIEGNAHPLLREMASGNLIQIAESSFTSEFEKMIFHHVDKPGDLIIYLREIFMHLLEILVSAENRSLPELHREFIFRLLVQLNKLEQHLQIRPDMQFEVIERLFFKMVASLRVPFEGEPLSGLQVMGILETRLLDFKHVILLSMNEEVMPASPFRQSYIPYSLRQAFGMPSREDMDAIYAYYFYRLLQRAEKVDLLYNGTSEGVRTGEMSRYLHQLKYNRQVDIIRPGMEVTAREVPAIVIKHTSEISEKLSRYSVSTTGEKYISPSAINTYIDCSLKFYLRYIAGIGEPDEVHEEIDAAGFGTVVHDSIKILYDDITSEGVGIIEKAELKILLETGPIEEVVNSVFRDHHFKGRRSGIIEGRNIIIIRVMIRILKKIIETDIAIAPITLVSLEDSFQRELKINLEGKESIIRIGGKIDRVDRVGGTLRVIDYKTGNSNPGFSSIEALFDGMLGNRNGAALQTLLYAWLVSPSHPGEPVTPGLYVIKSLYESGFDPALTMGWNRQKKRIDSFFELEEEFMDHMVNILERLFDPSVPFTQTENESRCRYCDFSGICSRTIIE